jgi:hypothetical protein
MDAGTFDARPDRHLTWMPIILDEIGWQQVIGLVDAAFHQLESVQAAAKQRLADSDEKPIIGTVFLLAFESPRGSTIGDWILD